MIRSAMTLATAGLLAACAAATPPQPIAARLGVDPLVTGGSYDSGGGISVAVDLREQDGRTMVCGVWAESRQQSILTNNKAEGVLDTSNVALGGETILRGLRFMKQVSPMEDYGGQQAHCAVTPRPWKPGDEARRAEIHIPSQVVHVEDEERGGAFIVRFRQTGPGAGGS